MKNVNTMVQELVKNPALDFYISDGDLGIFIWLEFDAGSIKLNSNENLDQLFNLS